MASHTEQLSPPVSKQESILIVGAGVFGMSLALELRQRGYEDITILDRFLPPVPDGSSVDISRIIRFDYADELYMKMAQEAQEGWKQTYKEYYQHSGILVLSQNGHSYLEQSKRLLKEQGAPFKAYEHSETLRQSHPSLEGNISDITGYENPSGGWADAAGAIKALATDCSSKGVSFITGSRGTVVSLQIQNSKVTGVNVLNGPPIQADRVILATGAWTARLLDLSQNAVSTAQPIGFIQLTAEEAKRLKDLPVCINLTTGWFCFPPTPDTHILKVARHGYGYESRFHSNPADTQSPIVSAPPLTENGARAIFIPEDADSSLREGLKQFFNNDIAERPWIRKILCWYTDTPKGDFIVDHHPEVNGLFLATGGSGHAFKFLPILGKYTADVFESKADQSLRDKWALKPGDKDILMKGDGSRGGPPRRKLEQWEQSNLG